MLDLAGIPLRAADRDADHPLVIAGGSGCYNPEPMSAFFDAMVIGEGEEVIFDVIAAHEDVAQATRYAGRYSRRPVATVGHDSRRLRTRALRRCLHDRTVPSLQSRRPSQACRQKSSNVW